MSAPPPAVFIGHGSPMNALETNRYTAGWAAMSAAWPRPKAIVCISAHWYTRGTRITRSATPETIHDFGGFPRELYEVHYRAPGAPELAARLQRRLESDVAVQLDGAWGLDHGAWSILVHLYPDADIPVVQLSLDRTKPARFHYELGAKLAGLEDEGILLLGSGNIVHNLEAAAWGGQPASYDWAERFDAKVQSLLDAGEHGPLVAYETLGRDATLSVPTPEHYLPLLSIAGASRGKRPRYPVTGFDVGSISMRCVEYRQD